MFSRARPCSVSRISIHIADERVCFLVVHNRYTCFPLGHPARSRPKTSLSFADEMNSGSPPGGFVRVSPRAPRALPPSSLAPPALPLGRLFALRGRPDRRLERTRARGDPLPQQCRRRRPFRL